MKYALLTIAVLATCLLAIGCSDDTTSPASRNDSALVGVTYEGVSPTEARIAAELVTAESVVVFRDDAGDVLAAARTGNTTVLHRVDVLARTTENLLTIAGTTGNYRILDGQGAVVVEAVDGVAGRAVDKRNDLAFCEAVQALTTACCVYNACNISCEDWLAGLDGSC